MTLCVFLDDERNPSSVTWVNYRVHAVTEWYTVRDYGSFQAELLTFGEGISDTLFSFDHDIQSYDHAGKEVTGYDCLKMLVDFCFEHGYKLPKCVFHTKNPVGLENMKTYYENALKFEDSK